MFKHSLNDSAAVRVRREIVHLTVESIDNKLDMLRWYALDCLGDTKVSFSKIHITIKANAYFLYNMIAVLIFNTFQDAAIQLTDELGLLLRQYMFESLKDVCEHESISSEVYKLQVTLPFVPHDNHTSGETRRRHVPPSGVQAQSFEPGYHAQRTFARHSCQKRPSSTARRSAGLLQKPSVFLHCWPSLVSAE